MLRRNGKLYPKKQHTASHTNASKKNSKPTSRGRIFSAANLGSR